MIRGTPFLSVHQETQALPIFLPRLHVHVKLKVKEMARTLFTAR
jgi:hypothetical protein